MTALYVNVLASVSMAVRSAAFFDIVSSSIDHLYSCVESAAGEGVGKERGLDQGRAFRSPHEFN